MSSFLRLETASSTTQRAPLRPEHLPSSSAASADGDGYALPLGHLPTQPPPHNETKYEIILSLKRGHISTGMLPPPMHHDSKRQARPWQKLTEPSAARVYLRL